MSPVISRPSIGLLIAGCLALSGCRGESERFHWKSPLAWRPFGLRHVAEAPVAIEKLLPGPAADSPDLRGPLLVESPPSTPTREDEYFVSPDIGMPVPPPAPPADGTWPIERITEGRRLPQPGGNPARPASPGDMRGGRGNLSDAIERLRERRASENRREDIPWNEPVADAGQRGGAPRVVGFDQYQPVTLGAPVFELQGPLPQVIANGSR
jgi:hypothetical protein